MAHAFTLKTHVLMYHDRYSVQYENQMKRNSYFCNAVE